MKVIINGEGFELSKHKFEGEELELDVFGYKSNFKYNIDSIYEFRGSNGFVMVKLSSKSLEHSVEFPIVVSNYKTTSELFMEELKSQLTQYIL